MMINNKTKKRLHFISIILFNVFAFIFGLTMLLSTVASEQEGMITAQVFGGEKSKYTNLDGPEQFSSDHKNIKELRAANNKIGLDIETEGIVLLKNSNVNKTGGNAPALPLANGNKVNLYSVTSVDPIYSVRGAGGVGTPGGIVTDADQKLTYKEVLEGAGLDVNDDLYNWYNACGYKRSTIVEGGNGNGALPTINDANWGEITSPAKTASADAAIFVLGRLGNEAVDMLPFTGSKDKKDATGLTDGDYLKLTPKEIDVLTNLKAQKAAGTFKSIILVINSANPIVDNVIDNAAYGIDAALWIGNPGTSGLTALGNIIAGKETPSGRMSDMWFSDKRFNPTLTNWGDFQHKYKYVVYQEGIYLGYRYAETRYEDTVLGTDKVGTFDYNEAIAFPFGYGLSYTNFAYSNFTVTAPAANATAKEDQYTVSVKVKNTGATAGKEVVQIYLQQPYTQYDKDNQIEKSAVELVGFAKTAKLAPNAEETVEIKVEGKYFASFDARGAGTYYLDEGSYYLTAAKDAHDATNNILAAKGKTTTHGMTANGDRDLAVKIDIAEASATKYANASNTGNPVNNIFDNSDPNLLNDGVNSVKFMTRSDWAETVKFGWDANGNKLNNQVVMQNSAKIEAGHAKDDNGSIPTDTIAYPTYGKDSNINLFSLLFKDDGVTKREYNDPLWNTFLDQLTWSDTVRLLSYGLRKTTSIDSIAKPATVDHNGPSGFSEKYGAAPRGLATLKNDPDKDLHPTGYPCSGIIASTFNIKLAELVGNAIGEDALWMGNSGIYGLGINLHRSPYHGRAAEYYSEDAYLTGVIAGYESKGIWDKGCYVYSKHLVLNEQEVNRVSHEAWITEQTLRQNYLRQYELCIEIGDAMNVMTAFNRLGSVWAGNNKNLCTEFLRTEAGMRGFAVTDWFGSPMGMAGGVLAGNDLPDGDGKESQFAGMDKNHGELANAMRESAHRILYTVVQSSAMNNFTALTEVRTLEPTWIGALLGVKITVSILFALAAAFMVTMTTFWFLDKNKEKKAEKTLE